MFKAPSLQVAGMLNTYHGTILCIITTRKFARKKPRRCGMYAPAMRWPAQQRQHHAQAALVVFTPMQQQHKINMYAHTPLASITTASPYHASCYVARYAHIVCAVKLMSFEQKLQCHKCFYSTLCQH
jgi:hypothetical protein